MCSIHLLKLISIFFRKRAFHKKYFIPLWRTIKPNIIYGKEGRRFLSLHICVGNPRRAKRNRILKAVRKRVYRWDWDGPDIMKAFTSANVQQTLWNVRNFRSYAASNLATVDAPGCDYFVLRKKSFCALYLSTPHVFLCGGVGVYMSLKENMCKMCGISYRRGLYCCSFSSIGHFSRPQSVDRTTDGSRFFYALELPE